MTDLIERTWEELSEQLGGKKIRATGYRLWVRTHPHKRKSVGGVWLPPKMQQFHGEMPHLVRVEATVLSAGPVGVAAEFKPGDVVTFQRLHFGYMWKLADANTDRWGGDEQYVGWVDANQVIGFVDGDEEDGDEDRGGREAEHAAAAAG